ncbi:hypothetical protein WR25_26110 isoform H [Diploscapter pachys]|uniref:PPM-type phosphatase domain-containing protein n=1 Tax=Diploscapter pachys TaxID=2018661 RepID=A0A2A2J6D4_9BILA|nr:hypothetical protein WR25_26110 isoform H [Diploscapter pachys]
MCKYIFIPNLIQPWNFSKMTPNWVAYIFGNRYISQEIKQLGLDEKQPFVEGVSSAESQIFGFLSDIYDTVDTSSWCKKLMNGIPSFAEKILKKELPDTDLPREWLQFPVSNDSRKGKRKSQEDRYISMPTLKLVFPDTSRSDVGLFGVFDGHNGAECSTYSAAHLATEFNDVLKQNAEGKRSLEESLQTSVVRLEHRLFVRCDKEQWRSGSTAVVMAVDNDEMSFAWLGDSAAFILKSSSLCQRQVDKIPVDHSTSNKSEAERVEADGGQLLYIGGELRVNGVLNVTRALGDIGGRPMVSGAPEIKTLKRSVDDYLVLLVCDGITDAFDNENLFQIVEAFVNDNPLEDYEELAQYICMNAIRNHSEDNVTCIAVYLKHPAELWKLLKITDSEDEEEENGGSLQNSVDDQSSRDSEEENKENKHE